MKTRTISLLIALAFIVTLNIRSVIPTAIAQSAPTWEVQSDYFGERNTVAQPRTIRSVALSHDGLSVYTGNIQSPNVGTTSLRKVSSAVLAIPGTDHVIFGNGMPGGTGGFAQVGGQPVYAGGSTGTFHAWRDVGNSPEAIDTDDRGYVYVALQSGISSANAVIILSADLSTQLGGMNLSGPTGVAIHKIGSTYYAYVAIPSAVTNGLQRWDVTDPATPVLDNTWTPTVLGTRSLTVDTDGTVFAADAAGGRVYRISADGTTSSFVSVPNAAGIAVFEDKLYVIKRQSPTQPIVVLNKADLSSGGPDLVVPALGGTRGDLSQFTSIDVNAEGRLYVSEENYAGATTGTNSGALTSYVPPATSFNPTPAAITGRIYFDRVLISSVVAQAPTAVDDTATVAEDDPATTIDVLANDTDPDGGPKFVVSATDPTNGTVVVAGDGLSLTYQPDANYCNNGTTTDDFTYTLNRGSTATVAVTVTCVDDAPTAVNDTATVTEDDPATTIDVLANDTDIDGGLKTITAASDPTHGTVVITNGGADLTYQPDTDYCNDGLTTDDFTYTLNGGSTATVAVTVTCVDDAPTAVDDTATVAEDDPATTIDVLANDTDNDGGPKLITIVTQPLNGEVEITNSGADLTYQPDASYCNDSSTTDDFTYTLNGGSTATVAVTVTCVDDAPTAVDDSATVTEDAPATTINVLANDTDIDGGPKIIASASDPVNGTVVVAGDSLSLTYQPNANYCNDGVTTDDFTYTLNGGSTATVAVTVTCVDDAPTVTINQATGQSDPTNTGPIHFTVVFNEPVTGFGDSPSDVILSGTAGATTALVSQVAPNDGTTYNVAVSGMTSDGTVIASIPSGAATDSGSNGNTASTSTDNTVTFIQDVSAPLVIISSNTNGRVDNLSFRDEDIIVYDPNDNTWSLLFDGSDVGLGNVDVDAFGFLDDGRILLSVDKDFNLINFGQVDESDILAFAPTQLGTTTTGGYTLYFDGSDVGLTSSGEDIDAIDFDADNNLVISVSGAFSAPGLSGTLRGNDEDLFLLNNGSLGQNTSGQWSLYFDGSDIGLTTSNEDINALWADHDNQTIYFALYDNYAVTGGLAGNEDDIVACTYTSLGDTTSCSSIIRYWNGDADHDFDDDKIDGLSLGEVPTGLTEVTGEDLGIVAVDDTVEQEGDDIDEVNPTDEEEPEAPEQTERLYLPTLVH